MIKQRQNHDSQRENVNKDIKEQCYDNQNFKKDTKNHKDVWNWPDKKVSIWHESRK